MPEIHLLDKTALYIIFGCVIIISVSLDLGIFNRKAHVISFREAAVWTVTWILLSSLFFLLIYLNQGRQKGLEFITGYLMEYSLSVDNIFVFIMIFSYFSVPPEFYHRILFWGILGAVLMRATFIFLGSVLIAAFHWILYLFGIFLLFTGIKLLFQKELIEGKDIDNNLVLRLARKVFPLSAAYSGQKFFVRTGRRLYMTPLFLVLLMVETTDLVFAVDSIPAVFGITQDTFIIYTSNIFAIMGLRSLFFLLQNMMNRFYYLKSGISVILSFIGIKMIVEPWYEIGIQSSLLLIVITLLFSVIASLLFRKNGRNRTENSQIT